MELIVRFPQMLLASLRDAPWVWAAGVVLVVIVSAVGYRSYRNRHARRLRRTIRGLGSQVLSNVLIPDSVEGQVHVDYLVLSAGGILVIDIKDYRGMLFGGENTDVWTQVVDGRSYKFDNPLHRNRAREAAVRALAPGETVRGIVVFTDAGHFPRQRPPGVYMLASLTDELALGNAAVPAALQGSWDQIERRVRRVRG